ncbi:MAG: flagellar biosynthesis protein FlhF [Bermanella sp.]
MKVKRFTATSMQKALKTVRDEMGPDAVILSNHRVSGGVEIIVAQNYQPVSAHKMVPPHDGDAEQALPAIDVVQPAPRVPAPKSFLSDELDKLKKPAAARPTSKKPQNPWPFLSQQDRQDVEEQLRQQDKLESVKKHDKPPPVQVRPEPTIEPPAVAPVALPQGHDKADLQQALQHIKQQRQDGVMGQLDITPPKAQTVAQAPAPVPEVNQKLIAEVRTELHDLTEMLKASTQSSLLHASQPSSFVWKKYSPSNALQAKLWGRLESMGFEEWLIYQLLGKLASQQDERAAWQACLQELSAHLHMSPSDPLEEGGIFALVGPTGAGKTTTIAKMAVRFTLEHEGAKVGLITMDNYRLAAHDQLRTLGQILGVQMLVADQDHSVLSCIETLQECDLVLIDTAGLSPEHPMLDYQLQQLAQLKGRINTLLTLPATSNSRVLRKVYHNYKAAQLTGCVLSKLDEASSLGDAISVLLESDLPLSYITDGQRIPDDFQRASAKGLVKRVVQVAKQEQQMAYGSGLAAGAW